ncbi:MAG TPA: AMP-binding protein, partial [Acidimicrobiales bacterium]
MAEILKPFADETPRRPALVDDTGTTTWAQLDERVDRLINALRSLGVGPGDVVAALVANRREYYELFLAAAHGGFLVAPVNWHFVTDEVAYVLDNSEAKVLVADSRYGDVAVAAAQTAPGLRARIAIGDGLSGFDAYEAVLAAADPAEPENQVTGGPMFYTSGTTGRPKGVRSALLSGGQLPVAVLSLMGAGFAASMGCPAKGVTFLNGPLYHSAQWAFSLFPMLAGSSVVIQHK